MRIFILFLLIAGLYTEVFAAKKFSKLGKYTNVKILKVNFKGIQIAHDQGIGYLDMKSLSEEDRGLLAEELAEYKKLSVGASKKIAAEKAQKVKDKRTADRFAADFKRIMGAPRNQFGYLLGTFNALNNRYKLKLIIPKRNKNGTLPPLLQQYEIVYSFMEEKTADSARQKEILTLLEKHYDKYIEQRKDAYKKLKERLTKQEEAKRKKGRTPKEKPVMGPGAKPKAKPAVKTPANTPKAKAKTVAKTAADPKNKAKTKK